MICRCNERINAKSAVLHSRAFSLRLLLSKEAALALVCARRLLLFIRGKVEDREDCAQLDTCHRWTLDTVRRPLRRVCPPRTLVGSIVRCASRTCEARWTPAFTGSVAQPFFIAIHALGTPNDDPAPTVEALRTDLLGRAGRIARVASAIARPNCVIATLHHRGRVARAQRTVHGRVAALELRCAHALWVRV